ncbi:glycosyltransferase [Pigmentiphaga aceris]|uniref:Glycosyltransferase n=1 Tax=Pigmentiphaga aceris TaxID=1940612 RepID=A0A5C0B6V2_9BURK|nr:glycosyltransferase [Pigmentiphaga aceris]QEI08387.1 glycosyltransferase [Pigmentiphaga aceris]
MRLEPHTAHTGGQYGNAWRPPGLHAFLKKTVSHSRGLSMHRYTPGQTIFSAIRAHTDAGRHDEAAKLLRIASCNPTTAAEAHIWEGTQVLNTDPHRAYRLFNSAVIAMPKNAELHLLQARAAELAGEPELAHQLTENALYVDPLSPAIRIAAWRSRARMQSREALQQQLFKALPDITDGSELAAVLPMLPPGPIGVVAYDPIASELHGWVIDPAHPDAVVQVECLAMDRRLALPADQASPLLRAAGLSGTHGGLRLKIPAGAYRLAVHAPDGRMLCGSPLVPLAPVVNPAPSKTDPRKQPVDVLIPVYRGEAETLSCIQSVLAARKSNGVKHEIIVLEDASPEPALVAALIALAQAGDITLVRHPANLGFIRGMNRGMVMHPERDVIWLNADTLVHGNWVDRLRQAAYSASDIASVTPFSNNGELMSFPEPSTSHPMPDAKELKTLDTLAAATKAPPVPLDVGNGFCLYVRRKAMAAIGLLDEIHMARGYGEETDWCLRATAAGFRHVGAPNLFVAHKGEVSFGAEKRARVKQNLRIIEQRYPWAEQAYVRFTLMDPVEPARQRLQAMRVPLVREALGKGLLAPVLYLVHNAGNTDINLPGKVNTALSDKTLQLTREFRHGKWWALLKASIAPLPMCRRYRLPVEARQLRDDISSFGHLQTKLAPGQTMTPALRALITELGLQADTDAPTAMYKAPDWSDPNTSAAWLIDSGLDPAAVNEWLLTARKLAADQSDIHLLLPRGVPNQTMLEATGVVLRSDTPARADALAHARAAEFACVLNRNGGHEGHGHA